MEALTTLAAKELLMKKQQKIQTVNPKPFGFRDIFSYALGDFGCNMSFALKNILAVFWTQYMGLENTYSLLLVIVNIWDAVNDPVIGAMLDTDRRVYKKNKFTSYINVGSIGLIFSGALCFIPLPTASSAAKISIFIFGYIVWDAFYTLTNVPYGSLLTLISDKQSQRASLSAWRTLGSTVGNMLPTALIPFIIYDSNNNLLGDRIFIVAIVMGLIGFVSLRIMTKTTEIRNPTDEHYGEHRQFNVLESLKNFLKNRAAVGVTVAAVGMFFGMHGSSLAVTVLFQSYFENVSISGAVSVISMLPAVLFTPLAGRLSEKFGKKELTVSGFAISIISCFAMLLLPIQKNNSGIAVYTICQILNNAGIGIFGSVNWALMGDAVDKNELLTGRREEGMIFSLHSFFRKTAQGLSPALVLVVMNLLGYVGENGGNQTSQTAVRIRYLVAALYLAGAVISFTGMKFIYDLDKKTVDEMHRLGKQNKNTSDEKKGTL